MHVDSTRSILALSGDDRVAFLQGILTQDMNLLRDDRALFSAMLSPQGKILHDFFILSHQGTLLLDSDRAQSEALLKRLNMYKLRANVAIQDVSDKWRVAYRTRAEHSAVGHVTPKKGVLVMTDPRAAELGERLYLYADTTAKHTIDLEDYHLHRMKLGVPDSARDIRDDVAMDAGYDALNAISFTKGCYVGQEVTARMHYKNIARRGFYVVESDTDLPACGMPIHAAGQPIGTLRGSQARCGLAMMKFEEAEQAIRLNTPLTVDNRAVRISAPAWLHPKLAQFRAAHENQ